MPFKAWFPDWWITTNHSKIKRSTMVGKINHGGLIMPDFEIINKSLKADWVKRFLTPETQAWKTIPLSLLQAVGGFLLFKCNFSLNALPDLPVLPQFYKDVLCLGRNCYPYSQDETRNKRRDLVEKSTYNNWRKICLLKRMV